MKQETEREKKSQALLTEIGEKIKAKRLKKEFSQIDLGDLVGSNQDHISKVEAGKINMTLEYLCKIAEALGVTVKYFFK